ncbi:hypothetical protein SALB_04921 [Streptomyces noursei]|uniref:Uncharacterized protein n=1 Tax=Streptomyces noursei TaxID=1971 RepID=A0A401R3E1_STRNR|nr:hypothetical protein SALB_04921 [Streptomyces noursei]
MDERLTAAAMASTPAVHVIPRRFDGSLHGRMNSLTPHKIQLQVQGEVRPHAHAMTLPEGSDSGSPGSGCHYVGRSDPRIDSTRNTRAYPPRCLPNLVPPRASRGGRQRSTKGPEKQSRSPCGHTSSQVRQHMYDQVPGDSQAQSAGSIPVTRFRSRAQPRGTTPRLGFFVVCGVGGVVRRRRGAVVARVPLLGRPCGGVRARAVGGGVRGSPRRRLVSDGVRPWPSWAWGCGRGGIFRHRSATGRTGLAGAA